LLRFGIGKVSEELIMVQICREMHWTYQEFLEQPAWFIDLLIEILDIETREMKRKEKLAELKMKAKQLK